MPGIKSRTMLESINHFHFSLVSLLIVTHSEVLNILHREIVTMDMIQAIAPESQGHCSISRAFAWRVRSPGFDSIIYYRCMLVYMRSAYTKFGSENSRFGSNYIDLGIIQVQGVELTKHVFLNCPRYINSPKAHCGWELRPLF